MADEKDFETLAELEEKMIEQQQIAQSVSVGALSSGCAGQRRGPRLAQRPGLGRGHHAVCR